MWPLGLLQCPTNVVKVTFRGQLSELSPKYTPHSLPIRARYGVCIVFKIWCQSSWKHFYPLALIGVSNSGFSIFMLKFYQPSTNFYWSKWIYTYLGLLTSGFPCYGVSLSLKVDLVAHSTMFSIFPFLVSNNLTNWSSWKKIGFYRWQSKNRYVVPYALGFTRPQWVKQLPRSSFTLINKQFPKVNKTF